MLLTAEARIGQLHAAVKAGEHWVAGAETEADRQEAERFLAAAHERLLQRWAERDGQAQAAALSPDEQERWDAAEHDRRYCEERADAYSAAGDRYQTVNDEQADRYYSLAANYQEQAEVHAATQREILAGATARRTALAPAAPTLPPAARLAVNPDHDAVAAVVAERGADAAVSEGEAARLLGADRTGLDQLAAAGLVERHNQLVPSGTGGQVLRTSYRVGSVAAVAEAARTTPIPRSQAGDTHEPFKTKAAARAALGEVGTRWAMVGPSGEAGRTVTVIRSSTTSRWTRGDDDQPGQRPAWRSLELGPGWVVRPDGLGVTDPSGWSIVRAA